MVETRSDRDAQNKVWDMIRHIKVATMVTLDAQGHFRGRPMWAQQESFDTTLWFFARKDSPVVREIAADARVLLAYADEPTIAAVLSGPLESVTSSTVVDREELLHQIDLVRRNGYTFSFEERVAGIRSIAVPLWDYTGSVIAAMSVTGPAMRVTEDWMYRNLPAILQAAADISSELGYSTPV